MKNTLVAALLVIAVVLGVACSGQGPPDGQSQEGPADNSTSPEPVPQMRLAWVARWGGGGDCASGDVAHDVAVDAWGNVYVTGDGCGGLSRGAVTIKYDADGNELWVARYHGPIADGDGADAIAVGADGSVFVAGHSYGRQWKSDGETYLGCDYATVKYDAQGREQWVARYTDPGGGDSYVSALALDSAGNALVTGTVWRIGLMGGGGGLVTVKYDAGGNELWARIYGRRLDDCRACGMALDSCGSIYIAGESSHSQGQNEASDVDCITIKYGTDGTLLCDVRYDGAGSERNSPTAMALDGAGNVYLAGWVDITEMNTGFLTVKYQPVQAPLP